MAIRRIDPAENEFLASLEAKAKQANPFFRVMANRPEVMKTFVPLYGAVMGPGSVDRRIKALMYLVASIANQCAFCIAANLPGARKAGITEEEIRAIEIEQDGGFSPAEQAAVAYARELTRSAAAGTSRREALGQYFTDEQIVEITLVIAMSNFTNRFNNGLNILPEGQQAGA
jgi:uncharacterized peroxidase-related enzyme